MLKPVLVTPPASYPVDVADVKVWCRIEADDTEFNDVLETMIGAAVARLDGPEGILGRAIVTQTWRQDFDGFGDEMFLLVGPFASVTSVTYYDEDNATQTLSTDVYTTTTDDCGTYLSLKPDQEWPTTYSRDDAVRVTYVAGVAAADVSPDIKAAISMHVSSLYENREMHAGNTAGYDAMVGTRRAMTV